MSIDNGVYIAEFPIAGSDKKEYRVIETQCIENCTLYFIDDVDENKTMLQDAYRFSYFSEAKVFDNLSSAEIYANQLYCKTLEEYGIVEYGVSVLYFDRPLSSRLTIEMADEIIDDM